jgi:hypothetical protein
MTVSYEKNYGKVAIGYDWELLSDVKMKDSAIIHALEAFAALHTEMCFSGMYQLLKSRYAARREKSKCTIVNNADWGTIEVCGKSLMFPRFFIKRIEPKNIGK